MFTGNIGSGEYFLGLLDEKQILNFMLVCFRKVPWITAHQAAKKHLEGPQLRYCTEETKRKATPGPQIVLFIFKLQRAPFMLGLKNCASYVGTSQNSAIYVGAPEIVPFMLRHRELRYLFGDLRYRYLFLTLGHVGVTQGELQLISPFSQNDF